MIYRMKTQEAILGFFVCKYKKQWYNWFINKKH